MAVKRLYKYEVGDEVVANELCKISFPNRPGKKGIIFSQLSDSPQFDYEVIYNNNHSQIYRFKEEELDYPEPYKEEINC